MNDSLNITTVRLFAYTKTIVKNHYIKWNKWIAFEDLESEAMFWLATHVDKINSKDDEKHAFGYMGKSLNRLLTRYSQDALVKNATLNSIPFYDAINDGVVGTDLNFITPMTYNDVLTALSLYGSEWLTKFAKFCTDKQEAAVRAVYVDGLTANDAAAKLGCSNAAIYSNADRGIKNIVVKMIQAEYS